MVEEKVELLVKFTQPATRGAGMMGLYTRT
jgi:hypothetical protein